MRSILRGSIAFIASIHDPCRIEYVGIIVIFPSLMLIAYTLHNVAKVHF